jgi:hypothetical protein
MKRTLYIIVIVVGLGGALVMGYLAMTSSPDSGEIVVEGTTTTSEAYNILPYGDDLNFETLENFNKDHRLYPYPEVNPAEVGKPLGVIIE